MNLIVKKIAGALSLLILKKKAEQVLFAARIEAARNILLSADALRNFFSYVFVTSILIAMMGAGLALFMVGICTMATMWFMDAKIFDLFFWIPLGFCFGGLICFIPSFLVMKYRLLSEQVWLDALKKNKIFGQFLCDVLEEAKKLKDRQS